MKRAPGLSAFLSQSKTSATWNEGRCRSPQLGLREEQGCVFLYLPLVELLSHQAQWVRGGKLPQTLPVLTMIYYIFQNKYFPVLFILSGQFPETLIILSPSPVMALRLAQGHTTSKHQCQNLNPVLSQSKAQALKHYVNIQRSE